MAYAIEKGESLSAALPRIVIERIDTAYEQLHDGRESPEERIHNARKRFKEARAAVRMIRHALGDQFAIENAWFRDAGRDLAALRDADAVLEALAGLVDEANGYHQRRVLRRARRRLTRTQRSQRSADLDARIDNTSQQLPIARARVTTWPLLDDAFATIGNGMRRTYRDGREAFHQAMDSRTPEAFHEWRKRVKDHWYHTQILRHIHPEFMKPYRDQMEKLSDALGDRHDLDVLQQIVRDDAAHHGNDFDQRVIHDLIDARIGDLTAAAVAVGRVIYAEAPRNVIARFEAYWTVFAA